MCIFAFVSCNICSCIESSELILLAWSFGQFYYYLSYDIYKNVVEEINMNLFFIYILCVCFQFLIIHTHYFSLVI